MLASRTARWSAGTALVCVLLLVATWFLLISPRREHVAQVRAEQQTAQQANDLLRTKVEQLKAEYADLPLTRARLDEIHGQLPAAADVPTLLRTVSSLAAASGTTLVSVEPGTPVTVGADGAPAAAGGAKPPVNGLVAIPMAIVVTGDYFPAVTFLRQLQTGMPRAFLVTGLQIANQDNGSASGSGSGSGSGSASGSGSGSGSGSSSKSSVKMTVNGQIFALSTSTGSGASGGSGAGTASGSSGGSGAVAGAGAAGAAAGGATAGTSSGTTGTSSGTTGTGGATTPSTGAPAAARTSSTSGATVASGPLDPATGMTSGSSTW